MAQMTQEEMAQTIQSLQKEVASLKGVHAVQELMSRYFHYHTAHLHKRCWDELFAHKAPDVSAEIANWGKWEGPEAVKGLYCGAMGGDSGDDPRNIGGMHLHELDTPCIQVAGDGKTAKGVWYSPGHESGVRDGVASAQWCWSYIGTDFIKEDGEWKIWHYHCYAMFMTPFDKPWTATTREEDEAKGGVPAWPEGLGPNRPTTYLNEYRTTHVRELVPAPPMPYETFDPATAY